MATHGAKEVLCYPCALRMSILFQLPTPPLSLNQLLESAEFKEQMAAVGTSSPAEPVQDDVHHARFTVVHETPASVIRYAEGERRGQPVPRTAPSLTSAVSHDTSAAAGQGGWLSGSKGNSCVDGMFGGEGAATHDVSWLCIACLGLYQFMDLVHAPSVAADVRRSPFFDSTDISVNLNVNRSLTFTWLAAATRYYDRTGTMTERPRATAVIPEELSNFKEFYMSDLRARVLQYLLRPHAEVLLAASQGSKLTPGIETYRALLEESGLSSAAEPPMKTVRRDTATADANEPPTRQGFAYSPEGNGVVCEVYCRHHPTEGLITEQHIPPQYCSNKQGCVLTYSLIYDYAVPFLESAGWAGAGTVDNRRQRREAAVLSTGITHTNIYLIGSYRKMMRNLSQSPWFADGMRVGSFSLQEVIANPVLPFFFPTGVRHDKGARAYAGGGNEAVAPPTGSAAPRRNVDPNLLSAEQVFGFGCYKFHSAGREDVDVRMLGTGRPFVLEIISPTREHFTESDLRSLEVAINSSHSGSVEVFHLRQTDANITVRLARHSESKIKRYRCIIWSSRAIHDAAHDEWVSRVNGTVDLQIVQKTPLRVLHRRSLHARPRTIHSMRLTPLNAHWFVLDVETQAGTYVKEFVHGDMGRTSPSLGALLHARTDILQLDVVGMAMQDLDAVPLSGSQDKDASSQ